MSQHYSDPAREAEVHALPDLEVFYLTEGECGKMNADREKHATSEQEDWLYEPGWYWWSCFPGCLPDSEPCGPFDTEEEALADAREEG